MVTIGVQAPAPAPYHAPGPLSAPAPVTKVHPAPAPTSARSPPIPPRGHHHASSRGPDTETRVNHHVSTTYITQDTAAAVSVSAKTAAGSKMVELQTNICKV